MGAFEELFASQGYKSCRQYREDLVSGQGNLASGRLAESMELKVKLPENITNPDLAEPAPKPEPEQLLLGRTGASANFGFVFAPAATRTIIDTIAAGAKVKLDDALTQQLLFASSVSQELWLQTTPYRRQKLVAAAIKQMVKKTDIQYRLHGDRLHYLVIGKVVTTACTSRRLERQVYPLLLFACVDTNVNKLQVEIEQTGFLNFWLDEQILHHEAQAVFDQSLEVTLDQNLPAKLDRLAGRLAGIVPTDVDTWELDPTYCSLGIITGFETEYVDPAWEEILRCP